MDKLLYDRGRFELGRRECFTETKAGLAELHATEVQTADHELLANEFIEAYTAGYDVPSRDRQV